MKFCESDKRPLQLKIPRKDSESTRKTNKKQNHTFQIESTNSIQSELQQRINFGRSTQVVNIIDQIHILSRRLGLRNLGVNCIKWEAKSQGGGGAVG